MMHWMPHVEWQTPCMRVHVCFHVCDPQWEMTQFVVLFEFHSDVKRWTVREEARKWSPSPTPIPWCFLWCVGLPCCFLISKMNDSSWSDSSLMCDFSFPLPPCNHICCTCSSFLPSFFPPPCPHDQYHPFICTSVSRWYEVRKRKGRWWLNLKQKRTGRPLTITSTCVYAYGWTLSIWMCCGVVSYFLDN